MPARPRLTPDQQRIRVRRRVKGSVVTVFIILQVIAITLPIIVVTSGELDTSRFAHRCSSDYELLLLSS
jgi:hypothetical protein